jgi:hypothetical protein
MKQIAVEWEQVEVNAENHKRDNVLTYTLTIEDW